MKRTTQAELKMLAADAIPLNDDEWGSDRQIAAENKFFAVVKTLLTPSQFARLEAYCLKAATEEMIAEALRLVGGIKAEG